MQIYEIVHNQQNFRVFFFFKGVHVHDSPVSLLIIVNYILG